MIIDCHYHLEPRLVGTDTLLRKMDAAGIDRIALMAPLVEPFPEPPAVLVTLLQFFLTHASFRWAARLSAARFTRKGDVKLPGGTFAIFSDPPNEMVFQVVDQYPDRFYGWVFVNPRGNCDPAAEFEKWRDHPGIVGVKAHPFWHRYPPMELLPVAQKAAKAGLPLLIHAGFGRHGDFLPLLEQVPELKLVLAHAGFPLYADIWDTVKAHPSVFVDLSQTSYVSAPVLQKAVSRLGAERCFFGTDGPFGHQEADGSFDLGYIKRRIEAFFPDKTVQARLLGDNFAACAGISGAPVGS